MAVPRLYVDFASQPSRALVWFSKLASSEIRTEIVQVRIGKGEHKKPEYLKINPFGKVPAMSEGDFNLFESHAILRYLVSKTKEGSRVNRMYPSDNPQARARIDSYLDAHHTQVRAPCVAFFARAFLLPRMGKDVRPESVARARKECCEALDQFERIYLSEGPFIAGFREPTLADLSAYNELFQLLVTDLKPWEGRGKLERWWREMQKLEYHDEVTQFWGGVAEKVTGISAKL